MAWLWWSVAVTAALIALSFALGCSGSMGNAKRVLNSAADAAEVTLEHIEGSYAAELAAVVDSEMARDDKDAAFNRLRAQYRPAFNAYRYFRLAWVAAAQAVSLVELAEASNETPNVASTAALLGEVVRTLGLLEQALRQLTAESERP